jgi:hypothetical protein
VCKWLWRWLEVSVEAAGRWRARKDQAAARAVGKALRQALIAPPGLQARRNPGDDQQRQQCDKRYQQQTIGEHCTRLADRMVDQPFRK